MTAAHIAGIGMLIVAFVAVIAFCVITALHVRRIGARAKALRSHPPLDPEWRARKLAVANRLSADARELQSTLPRLAAALTTIALSVDELVSGVRLIAAAVEDIFGVAVPWLRGLFA
jgi:hypothetical protein